MMYKLGYPHTNSAMRSAKSIWWLVATLLLAPSGVYAQRGGPPEPIQTTPESSTPIISAIPARDSISDSVGATLGVFRVSEVGSATYSIPLQLTPGVAEVLPKLALTYNSQMSSGVLGPGWGIEGLSQITRCRQSRESGDFMAGTTPIDGNPPPVVFAGTDRVCLDGIRLLATGGAYWADASVYAPENDPYTKVTYYSSPSRFIVERKDGTTAAYGDSDISPQSRLDTLINSVSTPIQWSLSRVRDVVGNYILYTYDTATTPGVGFNVGALESRLKTVQYTGLLGTTSQAPYATVTFDYELLPNSVGSAGTDRMRKGYQSGVAFVTTQRLKSITVSDSTAAAPIVRYYDATYSTSTSGSGVGLLSSITECRDATKSVCLLPTTFTWSPAVNQLATGTTTTQSSPDFTSAVDYKTADVDGDGRMDIVWGRNGDGSCSGKTRMYVSFVDRDNTTGKMILVTPPQAPVCTPFNLYNSTAGSAYSHSWHLMDYNGDGKADLLLGGENGAAWKLFAGIGRPSTGSIPVFSSTDSLAGLATPITAPTTMKAAGQLSDLNGDGLPDFVYATGSSYVYSRLMSRQNDGTLSFSEPFLIQLDYAPSSPCNDPGLPGIFVDCAAQFFGNDPKRRSVVISDIDADGRADLTVRMLRSEENCTVRCDGPSNITPRPTPYTDIAGDNTETFSFSGYWFQFTVSEIITSGPGGRIIKFKEYWNARVRSPDYTFSELPIDARSLYIVDVNGDGLSDIVYESDATPNRIIARLNTGRGYDPTVIETNISNAKHLQLLDIDGDGRIDLVYPGGNSALYKYKTLLADSTFSSEKTVGGLGMVAGNGMSSGSYAADFVAFAGDFDGDGANDFIRLSTISSSSNVFISRAPDGSRYKPRDTITAISNGFGAATTLMYQPLTNNGIYQRGLATNLRASTLNYGWNSPVFDLLSPMYVVATASSSAPRRGVPGAVSTNHYRYERGLMQAGGRGFLGFGTVWSFDPNDPTTVGPRYTTTSTGYAQNYPFIGMPSASQTLAFSGSFTRGLSALDTCASNPETLLYNCFSQVIGEGTSASVAPWPRLYDTGTYVHFAGNQLACIGSGCTVFAQDRCTDTTNSEGPLGIPSQPEGTLNNLFTPAAVTSPVFAHVFDDVDIQADLTGGSGSTGADQLMSSKNSYCYDDYGNLKYGRTRTYDSVSVDLLAQKHISNTYSTIPAEARLGRLKRSVVVYRRVDDVTRLPVPDITRTVDFEYYPTSLLLKSERLQKGSSQDLDFRSVYTYDIRGNKTGAWQCDASRGSDDQCMVASSLQQRPVDGTGHSGTLVHRYTTNAYDLPLRRYVTSSRQPYFNVSTNNLYDHVAMVVDSRDEFGNASQQTSPNGTVEWATAGSMGRPYHSSNNTGKASTTTYRLCSVGSVSCPSDAVFRSQTVFAGAPATWTFFDVLGRQVLSVMQAFDGNIAQSQFSASCSYYDAHGRTSFQTEPFFIAATSLGDGSPQLTLSTPCDSRVGTTTTYDVLGRIVRLDMPDTGVTTKAYLGLTQVTRNPRNYEWDETYNALGQILVSGDPTDATDPAVGLESRYRYDAAGSVLSITRNAGNGDIVSSMTYDALGRKITQSDPDAGSMSYSYNAAGEVVRQVDGSGNIRWLDYDAMGRLWRRTTSDSIVDTLTYDTAINGLGQLSQESRQTSSSVTFGRASLYDTYGRPRQQVTSTGFYNWTVTTAYDGYGRASQHQDASGYTLTTGYSPKGFPTKQTDSRLGTNPVYEILETTARGQVAKERLGNSSSLVSTKTYNPATGRLATVCSGSTSCGIQDLFYQFDTVGNLLERTYKQSAPTLATTELFTYDGLNRLKTAQLAKVNGVVPTIPLYSTQMTYDRLGNVCSRNGGAYQYAGRAGCVLHGAGGSPHAVTVADGISYSYDGGGNQTGDSSGRTLEYSAMNQLTKATQSTYPQVKFLYAPDGTRFFRADIPNASVECAPGEVGRGAPCVDHTPNTIYIGNVEIIRDGTTVLEYKRYLGGNVLDVVRTPAAASASETLYLFTDHLGSINVLANGSGAVVGAMNFDPHGRRRNPSDWSSMGGIPMKTTHGFTGHEHVDSMGLVHMNGRMYDPKLGRMLQADPFMESGNQGLNRYSYVLNNPLARTDPTGYMSVTDIVRTVAAAVIIYYTAGTASYYFAAGASSSSIATGLAISAAGGFAAGVVQTGTLQGGLYGAFSGALFGGINAAFANAGWATSGTTVMGSSLNSAGYTASIVANGAAGGVVSRLQGGKFGHGFASAGVSSAFGGKAGAINNDAGRAISRIVLGGTVSVIAGGKFANGAVTGAFAYAFSGRLGAGPQANSLSYENASGPDYWGDGSYDWRIKWKLDDLSQGGGWIVQEVNFSVEGSYIDGSSLAQTARYWEAWRIDPGQATTSSPLFWDDKFAIDTHGNAASIRSSVTASARFYEGLELPNTFRPNSVISAGQLPATMINPNLPFSRATQPVNRTFEHKWP